MWGSRYFTARFWTARFWSATGATPADLTGRPVVLEGYRKVVEEGRARIVVEGHRKVVEEL